MQFVYDLYGTLHRDLDLLPYTAEKHSSGISWSGLNFSSNTLIKQISNPRSAKGRASSAPCRTRQWAEAIGESAGRTKFSRGTLAPAGDPQVASSAPITA